jgi:hypothetical protein
MIHKKQPLCGGDMLPYLAIFYPKCSKNFLGGQFLLQIFISYKDCHTKLKNCPFLKQVSVEKKMAFMLITSNLSIPSV